MRVVIVKGINFDEEIHLLICFRFVNEIASAKIVKLPCGLSLGE